MNSTKERGSVRFRRSSKSRETKKLKNPKLIRNREALFNHRQIIRMLINFRYMRTNQGQQKELNQENHTKTHHTITFRIAKACRQILNKIAIVHAVTR